MPWKLTGILNAFLGVCLGLGCTASIGDVRAGPAAARLLQPRVIFTTAVGPQNDPQSNLREISIEEERIVIHISWFDIQPGEHDYKLEIYDGVEQLVSVQRMRFQATSATWSTVSWYRPKSRVDVPGRWRFAVFLDGRLAVEPLLTVVP